jgi:uncharacterized membrane protein
VASILSPITFEPALSNAWLGALAVCGLAVTVAAAWKTRRHRMLTALLTFVPIALVLGVLANPVQRGELPVAVPSGEQVLLLDTSASMSLGGAAPRWRLGLEWARPLLDDKADNLRTRLVTFDASCDSSGREPTQATGSDSRLAQAIESVLAQTGDSPPVHLIVVSDGIFNDAAEITRVLAGLQERHIVVSTHVVGSDAVVPNLFIRRIDAPRFAPPESVVPVRIGIGAVGLPSQTKARLQIVSEDQRVIAEREWSAGRQSEAMEFSIPLGVHSEKFQVQIGAVPGEISVEDNTATFSIEPLNAKIRVFLAEGSQGWLPYGDGQLATARFFPTAFQRAGDIECDLFQMPEQDKRGQPIYYVKGFDDSDQAVLDPTRTIPSDHEGWWRYDVIIISDIDRQMLMPHMEAVRQLVADRGGGFLMNGGNHSFDTGYYDQTIWEKLLPVDCLQFGFGHGKRPIDVAFPQGARSHPILQFTPEPALNGLILDCHPPMRGYHDIRRVKPGATTLATVASSGAPLVAVQDYGRGRAMAFLSDPAGGWGTEYSGVWGPALLAERGDIDAVPGERALVEDASLAVNEFYNRFWVNSIRWLAAHSVRRQERALLGRVSTAIAHPSDTLSISAELQTGEAADELPKWSVGVRVDGTGGDRTPLRYDRDRGEFVGEIPVSASHAGGEVKLLFDATDGARNFTDAVSIPLVRVASEFQRTNPDAQFMADIARAGGGRVLQDAAEARQISLAALSHARETRVRFSRPLWDRGWFWSLFVAVCGAKWWLWRRSRKSKESSSPQPLLRPQASKVEELAIHCFVAALLIVSAWSAEPPPASMVTKAARICLIFGHPGDDAHRDKFLTLRTQIAATLQTRFGISSEVLTIFDGAAMSAEDKPREHLLALVREAASAAKPDEAVWFIFVGHANSTRTGASFNLPGPDVTEKDLHDALEQTPANGPLVFICTQAASGRWARALAAGNRLIFAATRAYDQDNETEMPGAFAAALAAPNADTNRDGVVSLFELFDLSRTGVHDTFEKLHFFQMETPTLEANGDGRATAKPSSEDAEGAARIGLALTLTHAR